MLLCKRCANATEAVAIIPLPQPKPSIPVCYAHRLEAEQDTWYLEDLNGFPLSNESFEKRVDKKHFRIRGTHCLKYV